MFPLALLLAVKLRSRRSVIALMVFVAIVSFALSSWLVFRSPDFTFYMLPLRAWELLVGSILAITATAALPDRNQVRDAVSVAGLAAILAAVFLYDAQTPFPGASAAAPVLGAGALIWSGPQSLVGRVLSFKPLVFVGLISYSLYLWHWPVIVFHGLIFPEPTSLVHSAALITVSLILAVVSWRYIETPFRRPDGLLRTRRAVFSAAGVAAVTLSALAGLAIADGGWSWRAAPHVVALAETAEEKGISDSRCRVELELFTLRGRERGFCRIGADGPELPTTVIWGDSHVGAWYPMLDSAFENVGQSALAISMAGCPVAFDLDRAEVGREGCRDANRSMLEYLEENEIERVMIVASWFGVLSSKDTVYAGQRSFDDATRLENVLRAIADTGDRLEDMGIDSGFMMTVLGAQYSVPEALFREAQLGFYPEIRRSAAEYEDVMGPIRDVAMAHYDVVVETDQILCQSGFCDIIRDGRPPYYDSNHPSAYLNELMRPVLQGEISEFILP